MRNKLAALLMTAACAGPAVLPGCRSSAPPAPGPSVEPRGTAPAPIAPSPVAPTTQAADASAGEIIAVANGVPITRRQLVQPLIEAYGLGILLNLVQLEMARQQTARVGMSIEPADVQAERRRTFSKMFAEAQPADYETLLDQFLRQQHLSRAEFDLVIETNAHLRKFSESQLPGKISEEMVQSAFGQLYGENRQVRDIQLSNMREVGLAKERLAKGESFEHVARQISQDPRTAPLGGELPPFSQQAPNVPEAIKQAAFAMKVDGESDPLLDGTTYHLIKLVRVIPPKIVKFDDVKESVRQTLNEQWLEFAIKEYRNQLAQLALQTMQINEPVLREQWKQKLEQQHASIRDRDSALQRMNQDRQAASAATAPAGPAIPGTTPATAPATSGEAPVVERPPATMPGATAPGIPPVSAPATQP